MKKYSIKNILLFALLMMPFMASCGDDDENNDGVLTDSSLISQAVGTWMCTESTDTQLGQTYQNLMVGKEITINDNGTYTSTAQSFGYTGSYSVSGNKITAKSNNGSTFVITATINGNRMVWDGTASNGVTFRYVFEREAFIPSQLKPFTKELLVGDNSYNTWMVESYSIERGSNRYIEQNKILKFSEDGTCEAFHSMETGWRISNGVLETFYRESNEPMYIYTLLSDDGKTILVRMNGTLDDNLQATLSLKRTLTEYPNTQTVTEDFWKSKEDLMEVYRMCYSNCAQFIANQLNLEQIRLNTEAVHSITASTNQVSQSWTAAWTTINTANLILANADKIKDITDEERNKITSEIRAIRSFLYFNVAMLWGDVPLLTSSYLDDTFNPQQKNQTEVYQFAYEEISNVLSNLPEVTDQSESKLYFNKDAGRMLKSVLELTLGNQQMAKTTLSQIGKSQYETPTRSTASSIERKFIWVVRSLETEQYIPVYTFTHHQLFIYEINGNKDGLDLGHYDVSIDEGGNTTDEGNILSEWKNQQYVDYGYWAALKRLGKAQEVTGCYDFELLMPFPDSDIRLNPNMKQNTGY